MDLSKSLHAYTQLSREQMHAWLLNVAAELTVAARQFYRSVGGDTAELQALIGINELLHKILGQALHKMSQTPGYPDDVFLNVIIDVANKYGCSRELYSTSERVLKRL